MAFTLGEYQDIFLEEADDQLQELNRNLLELENNPDDADTINNIFRAAHSLKSSAAFVGLNDLSDLAHKMENLLQGIRDKTMRVTPEVVEVLFKSFDVISSVIESVSAGENPSQDLSGIIARIGAISQGGGAVASGGAAVKPETAEAAQASAAGPQGDDLPRTTFNADERKTLRMGLEGGRHCYEISVYIDPTAPMKWVKANLITTALRRFCEIIKTIPDEEHFTDDDITSGIKIILLTKSNLEALRAACNVDLVQRIEIGRITLGKKDGKYVLTFHSKEVFIEENEEPEAVAAMIEDEPEVVEQKPVPVAEDEEDDVLDADVAIRSSDAPRRSERGAPSLRTVKVSVDKLDELLNNVGELVIANSGFYRLFEELKKDEAAKTVVNEFKNRMEQMSRIAKDLQSGIMKTRMVPIGQVFSRFHRLVRDLAKDTGKDVQLITKGEETELDKKVIDVIGEPIMHMVRNSIDHGLESPDERSTKSKPQTGTVTLNAHQAGNQIFVEISDDGRGLRADRIRKKALERGLVSAEALSNMDDDDVYQFIFHPGFSTADKITDVSGRGVGMNVVREVVNEMNGSIDIETEPDMGTRFIMAFPLTLAIIPAIMVKVHGEMYAIPLSDVIETIKIACGDITTIEGHEVINLRGEILSLLRLNQFVGIDSNLEDDSKIPVVVVGYGNRKIGVIVDELEGKQEIVIKSLEQNYRTVQGLAGASILGDGSICLILDISAMISKVISEQDRMSREDRKKILSQSAARIEKVENVQKVAADHLKVDAIFDEAEEEPAIIEKATPVKSEVRQPEKANKKIEKPVSAPVEMEFEDDEEPVSAPIPVEPKIEAVAQDAPEAVQEDAGDSEQMDIVESESAGVAEEEAENTGELGEKVQEALQNFRDELQQNISDAVTGATPQEHMLRSMNMEDDDLKKIKVLANVGIMQGAESLSRLIGKRVDLAIPEVKMMAVESIPESIGSVNEPYVAVAMPVNGDLEAMILLSMPESACYAMIDDLFGFETGETKSLSEDGESALKELTNIVGASVVNAFSEKTGLQILPDVPTIIHDFMQSIMDSILAVHAVNNEYALIMETEFYYEDDRAMANLMILPETQSIKFIVDHLRE